MKWLLSRLGPGLLYAGAAVGVSHLVQSTRAGTNYGLAMVLVVIMANILKYPFFKAGPLYAASEKKSLLEAFHEEGKWAMGLFYLVTVPAMFTVQAVVTLITAGVFASIFQLNMPLWQLSGVLLLACSTILLIGRFKVLDNIMKTVILLLTITTLITLVAAILFNQPTENAVKSFSITNSVDIFFLIALIGWMPAPLDISLWHSEWTLKASQEKKEELDIKKSNFDFNIGYWGTTFLAVAFVMLGALILRGNVDELPSSGVAFSGQLIGMYVSTLGEWSFLFVALAAFTTMFSTTLTVLDAYPRVLDKAFKLSLQKWTSKGYELGLLLLVIGALFVLIFQLDNMKQLVDLATSISFLTAPILATLIYKVVMKSKARIFTKLEVVLAWLGLGFLYLFSGYFLWAKFLQ